VSPLRGEKPQNWPLSKLNTGRFALRAMLPVMNPESWNNGSKEQIVVVVVSVWWGRAEMGAHGCYKPCGVVTGWAGDGRVSTESEGRTLIQTQAIIHHSYDDVLNTPASASGPASAGAPATNQHQSLTARLWSVLLTCTPFCPLSIFIHCWHLSFVWQ